MMSLGMLTGGLCETTIGTHEGTLWRTVFQAEGNRIVESITSLVMAIWAKGNFEEQYSGDSLQDLYVGSLSDRTVVGW